jgi:hypothetical protein
MKHGVVPRTRIRFEEVVISNLASKSPVTGITYSS